MMYRRGKLRLAHNRGFAFRLFSSFACSAVYNSFLRNGLVDNPLLNSRSIHVGTSPEVLSVLVLNAIGGSGYYNIRASLLDYGTVEKYMVLPHTLS